MAPVIKIENLWKEYRLGLIGHGTLTHDLQSWWARLRGKDDPNAVIPILKSQQEQVKGNRFWALCGIDLEVEQGEVLGIIGRNGAGKSTLLKLLSRVTAPTKGKIMAKGRIASLLEVGTGFHPELTGRENIFLNGAILGMSKQEVSARIDEIVDFSEVEEFIDTPVKRYSSGMYVRLAFSVAAHLLSDILIVDEVLAVGDLEFQRKCLGKVQALGQSGRTVLFVSHNMGSIRSLCTKALLLSNGRISSEGAVPDVLSEYVSTLSASQNVGSVFWEDDADRPQCEELCFTGIEMSDTKGRTCSSFDASEPIKITINYTIFKAIAGLKIAIQIANTEGIMVMASMNIDNPENRDDHAPGNYSIQCTIPGKLLNKGMYFLRLQAGIPGVKVLIPERDHLRFYIEFRTEYLANQHRKRNGVVAPLLTWSKAEKD